MIKDKLTVLIPHGEQHMETLADMIFKEDAKVYLDSGNKKAVVTFGVLHKLLTVLETVPFIPQKGLVIKMGPDNYISVTEANQTLLKPLFILDDKYHY
jgi:hypothetical protein